MLLANLVPDADLKIAVDLKSFRFLGDFKEWHRDKAESVFKGRFSIELGEPGGLFRS